MGNKNSQTILQQIQCDLNDVNSPQSGQQVKNINQNFRECSDDYFGKVTIIERKKVIHQNNIKQNNPSIDEITIHQDKQRESRDYKSSLILEKTFNNLQQLEQALNQVKIFSQISHPNIVGIQQIQHSEISNLKVGKQYVGRVYCDYYPQNLNYILTQRRNMIIAQQKMNQSQPNYSNSTQKQNNHAYTNNQNNVVNNKFDSSKKKISSESSTPRTPQTGTTLNKDELITAAFTEKEIWYMVDALIDGLKIIQDNNIIHGDLRPQTIFLSENGHLKLSIIQCFNNKDQSHTNFNLACQEIMKGNSLHACILENNFLFSPQQLAQLKKLITSNLRQQSANVIKEILQKQEFHPYKSQIFSLGLLILQVIFCGNVEYCQPIIQNNTQNSSRKSLSSSQLPLKKNSNNVQQQQNISQNKNYLYNINEKTKEIGINFNLILNLLQIIKLKLSVPLYNLLNLCLQVNEQNRPDCIELYNEIRNLDLQTEVSLALNESVIARKPHQVEYQQGILQQANQITQRNHQSNQQSQQRSYSIENKQQDRIVSLDLSNNTEQEIKQNFLNKSQNDYSLKNSMNQVKNISIDIYQNNHRSPLSQIKQTINQQDGQQIQTKNISNINKDIYLSPLKKQEQQNNNSLIKPDVYIKQNYNDRLYIMNEEEKPFAQTIINNHMIQNSSTSIILKDKEDNQDTKDRSMININNPINTQQINSSLNNSFIQKSNLRYQDLTKQFVYKDINLSFLNKYQDIKQNNQNNNPKTLTSPIYSEKRSYSEYQNSSNNYCNNTYSRLSIYNDASLNQYKSLNINNTLNQQETSNFPQSSHSLKNPRENQNEIKQQNNLNFNENTSSLTYSNILSSEKNLLPNIQQKSYSQHYLSSLNNQKQQELHNNFYNIPYKEDNQIKLQISQSFLQPFNNNNNNNNYANKQSDFSSNSNNIYDLCFKPSVEQKLTGQTTNLKEYNQCSPQTLKINYDKTKQSNLDQFNKDYIKQLSQKTYTFSSPLKEEQLSIQNDQNNNNLQLSQQSNSYNHQIAEFPMMSQTAQFNYESNKKSTDNLELVPNITDYKKDKEGQIEEEFNHIYGSPKKVIISQSNISSPKNQVLQGNQHNLTNLYNNSQFHSTTSQRDYSSISAYNNQQSSLHMLSPQNKNSSSFNQQYQSSPYKTEVPFYKPLIQNLYPRRMSDTQNNHFKLSQNPSFVSQIEEKQNQILILKNNSKQQNSENLQRFTINAQNRIEEKLSENKDVKINQIEINEWNDIENTEFTDISYQSISENAQANITVSTEFKNCTLNNRFSNQSFSSKNNIQSNLTLTNPINDTKQLNNILKQYPVNIIKDDELIKKSQINSGSMQKPQNQQQQTVSHRKTQSMGCQNENIIQHNSINLSQNNSGVCYQQYKQYNYKIKQPFNNISFSDTQNNISSTQNTSMLLHQQRQQSNNNENKNEISNGQEYKNPIKIINSVQNMTMRDLTNKELTNQTLNSTKISSTRNILNPTETSFCTPQIGSFEQFKKQIQVQQPNNVKVYQQPTKVLEQTNQNSQYSQLKLNYMLKTTNIAPHLSPQFRNNQINDKIIKDQNHISKNNYSSNPKISQKYLTFDKNEQRKQMILPSYSKK